MATESSVPLGTEWDAQQLENQMSVWRPDGEQPDRNICIALAKVSPAECVTVLSRCYHVMLRYRGRIGSARNCR